MVSRAVFKFVWFDKRRGRYRDTASNLKYDRTFLEYAESVTTGQAHRFQMGDTFYFQEDEEAR